MPAFDQQGAIVDDKLNVGDICNRSVVTATEDMSLKDAANLMRTGHVGSLVVTRPAAAGNVVVGMITDRDIAIVAVARDFDPQTLRVVDVMATDIVTANLQDSVHEVLNRMRASGIRRMPVTDGSGVLQGLITLDDLLQAFSDELQILVQAVASERQHEAKIRR
jgi:CBS-domain-containing membrane protein